ncbi:hypothetical protein [Terriglobus sp. ADX1]|uniref:hypothetical protein n=1 Tax=Terriglobus sp. ADX1 TaxID=2794063 RepID=UPI002FE5CED5
MISELGSRKESTYSGTTGPTVEDCKEQARRVISSSTFRNASTLQVLLQFLTDRTLNGSADVLKEYTIGVEALGRKQDFDPKLDPIVRVQSHRLRVKLKEYYDLEGGRDTVLIELPKGHYTPRFETKPVFLPHPEDNDSKPIPDDRDITPDVNLTVAPKSDSRKPSWRIFLLAIGVIGLIALSYLLGSWNTERRAASGSKPSVNDDPVELFWARFLGNDHAPVIAYPDAVFLLDDANDLFWFSHGATDSRGARVDPHVANEVSSTSAALPENKQLYYENGYTGTGELESIGMLTRLFGHMGVEPIVKSSRDITPDDLSQHNVILLGSPFQNPAVEQLLTVGDFRFNNLGNHHAWGAEIANAHPQKGEASSYKTERDPQTQVLLGDYSLVMMANGEVPGRRIIILGGLDTKGTQGATMFATSKTGIDQLNKSVAKAATGQFQALVHVRLAKGYQVLGSDLVSVHPLPQKSR